MKSGQFLHSRLILIRWLLKVTLLLTAVFFAEDDGRTGKSHTQFTHTASTVPAARGNEKHTAAYKYPAPAAYKKAPFPSQANIKHYAVNHYSRKIKIQLTVLSRQSNNAATAGFLYQPTIFSIAADDNGSCTSPAG
jgi:hypothetical protein